LFQGRGENEKTLGKVFILHLHHQSLEAVISQRTGRHGVSGEKQLDS